MNLTLYIIIIVVCLILSAYFSATETAFSALSKARIKTIADKGNKRAKLVLKLSEKYDRLLSTILIGNNIVNILSASLCTTLFVFGIGADIGPTIATVVMTVVVLIFGEITPKNIAKESPERFAMFSAPILKILIYIFMPLTYVFTAWKWLLNKMFKSKKQDVMTEEELITIVEEAEVDGAIDEAESDLIISAIEFNELEVGDVFIPRVDVVALPEGSTEDEIVKLFAQTGYSRLPVYNKEIDNIVGVLYYKDFYNLCFKKDVEVSSIYKKAEFVAKSQKVAQVMRHLQKEKIHMAIVTDEFGSVAGIVTLEDILEEIVGDIWDEHDKVEQDIRQISENEYEVTGKASIEKVFDMLGIQQIPESLTANGWVMEVLQCVPAEGMEFSNNGLRVKVEKVGKRRAELIRIVDERNVSQSEE